MGGDGVEGDLALGRLLGAHEEGHLRPDLDDVARDPVGVGHGPAHVDLAEDDEEEDVEPDRGAKQSPEADGFVDAQEGVHAGTLPHRRAAVEPL